ncbi:MAG: FtsX-like permease family protein [Thermoplasmata archaeon]
MAITFISGTFIAIDSSARATLEGLLAGVSGDFTVTARQGDSSELQQTLQAYPGVVNATVYYRIYWSEPHEKDDVARVEAELLFVDPADLPRSWREAEVTGSLELPRGTIAVTQSLAAYLQVGLGDNITLRNYEWDYGEGKEVIHWLNLTVVALMTQSSTQTLGGPYYPYRGWMGLINIRDLDWFQEELVLPQGYAKLEGEVWVDRNRFIDPYDIPGSRRELARFERGLQEALIPYSGDVSNNIQYALSTYESMSTVQRVVFLILSLPVLLLGLYLGAVGVDLGHAERRQELAVLKTRGAGRGQVLGLLLLGAALSGVLATVIGLVAGIALSRLLLTVVNPFALQVAPSYGDVVLSTSTVIIVAVFSVLFMLLASYRSAKRTAGLPVAETLRYYAPGETKIEYKPTIDIVLVSLGIVSLLGVWYVRFNPGTFITFLVGVVFVVLLPLAPIFLIVGGTRLLTRSTGRIYVWAARLWRPLAGGLYHVISRNLARNPRRSSNVAIIIALGLAFGMFIFAFLGTTLAYQQRTIRANLGADMSIGWPGAEDTTFAQNVSALPQVAGITTVRRLYAEVYNRFVNVYAVDPDTLFSVTQPEPWYFDGLSADAAANILRERGQVLASKGLADTLFLEVGDRIPLSREFFNETSYREEEVIVNVTVAGIVRALPGTVSGTFGLPTALYASQGTLEPLLAFFGEDLRRFEGGGGILVDLHPGADWQDAKAAVVALGASDVRVYEEELLRQQSDPFFRSVLGFISMEVAFIVAILTAGLGLILFAATLERDVEFAAIRARGASGWQAAGLLTGEAFSIMLIGLAIGTGMGLLVAYFLLQVFVASFGPQEALVPFLFELPVEGFLLVGLAPLAMLLTALLIAWRVARMNTAKVLKLRGG